MLDWLLTKMPDLTTTIITTVAGGAFAGVWRASSWFYRENVKPRLEQLDEISKISYEVRLNGGGSLKDAVKKLNEARAEDRGILLEIRSDLHDIKNRNANRIYIDSQPIFESDNNGNCFRINRKWCELTGLSQEEALGHGWMSLIESEVVAVKISEKWERLIDSFEKFDEIFNIRNAIDKRIIKIRCVVLVQRNQKREIEYVLGTFEELK